MILFFIIGLAVMGLGIFAMVHSRRMDKLGKTYATVSSCVESSLQIMSASIPCYEVTFEIPTSYGVTYKTIKDEKSYNVGDTVEIFYDAEADKVELAKNVSPKNSKGPLLLIGFGAMICALIVATNYIGPKVGRDYEKSNVNSSASVKLKLNSDGYASKAPDMSADEKFSEYYFIPFNESENYGYNIKIYHSGIGVVLIFPTESMGKGLQQTFAFYVDEDELETVVKDTKEYNFADFTIEKFDGADNQYLYFYDGEERVGSGGWGTGSRLYDSVSGHIKECVPDKVWDAIEREIDKYYE